MRTGHITAVAIIAATLALAGCEAGASGSPSTGGCAGWGPLSDCGSSTATHATASPPAASSSGCSGWGPLADCTGTASADTPPSTGMPVQCPSGDDLVITYSPDTGDVTKVERATYNADGSHVHMTPVSVSAQCLRALDDQNHQTNSWMNNELGRQGAS